MVVLAAAIISKSGEAIVSRQFREMTRARIEGLLASFPKLIRDQQHTTVENDSVRYVYQPMDQLYLVLVTNRQSNILQDLDTLRLLAQVVSDQCEKGASAREVASHAFELADAFDEVIGLGYREGVSLQQVRTIIEMDSHEERIQDIIERNKEREAAAERKRRAKELDAQRKEMAKRGTTTSGATSGGYRAGGALQSFMSNSTSNMPTNLSDYDRSGYSADTSPAPSKSKGMQLGAKSKGGSLLNTLGGDASLQDTLHDAGIDEEQLASAEALVAAQTETAVESVPREGVHTEIEEKILVTANRDGGLENMEVRGALILHISDPDQARIKLELAPSNDANIQFKLHPNMDKKAFGADYTLALKDASRQFPVNTPLAVVKWRLTTKDEAALPLSINCWPSPSGDGACDVNIEYELEAEHMELRDLVIAIPYPAGATPVVGDADGDYEVDDSRGLLLWQIGTVDAEQRSGQLEFSVSRGGDDADAFFPVQTSFTSTRSYAQAELQTARLIDSTADTEEEIIFSAETSCATEEYTIV